MAGHDVLAVLPTGAGKSAIYQVPALLLGGPTVIVSPLISLQRDQVGAINESGAPDAVAINSAKGKGATEAAWASVRSGDAEYLFLSPEQLAKEDVLADVAELEPSLFVVDEAHCVSGWGHDFRPDYLRLATVIERLGHPRVLALTATAAPPIRADIIQRLGLRDPHEVVASFDRPNIAFEVVRFTSDRDKRQTVIERVEAATKPGLVYTSTRKEAEQYAGELQGRGVAAAVYHAGMKAADRRRVHRKWLDDRLEVVVATSAFGMGIDKADVRFVFHASIPDSPDSYYQEIGRGGRDGEPAAAVLFYREEDLGVQSFLTTAAPQPDALHEVAEALRAEDEPLPPSQLKDKVDVSPQRRTRAVNLLEQAGAVSTDGEGRLQYADEDPPAEVAVDEAVEVGEAHQRFLKSRVSMMRGYAETNGCRRQYLLGYFGEDLAEPCGNCDTCREGTSTVHRQPGSRDTRFRPNTAVEHEQLGRGVVLRIEEDRLTVLFEDAGYCTLSLQTVVDRDLLQPVTRA